MVRHVAYKLLCVTFFLICASLDWFKLVLRRISYKLLLIPVLFGLMWSMKLIIVILLATFVAVEAAHLNYHAQNCPKPQEYVYD